jgi:hypothetical protein
MDQPNTNWKDQRIKAINKLSKKKAYGDLAPTNPYFEEVHEIYSTEAKSLQEFKKDLQMKKFTDHFNSI